MLHLVLGDDRVAQKRYIQNTWGSTPGSELVFLDALDFTGEVFEQLLFGTSLFGDAPTIVLDAVCENSSSKAYMQSRVSAIAASDVTVVILEKKLEKSTSEKKTTKTKTTTSSEAEPDLTELLLTSASTTNTFALPEMRMDFTLWAAVYARDKKQAWTAYTKVVQTEAIEKVHAGILGQVRNIYIVQECGADKSAKELGITEGSFLKVQSAAKKYSPVEVGELYFALVELQERAHNGEVHFATELEKYILKYI
jgi:hypothetical protein